MNLKNMDRKQLILLIAFILILLIFLNNFIKYINSKSNYVIDYKNSTGASMVEEASVEYDRTIYYDVENFLRKYINSFSDSSEEYKNYYKKSTTDEFRARFSKSKYNKLATNFYNKIVEYNTIDTRKGEQLKSESSLYSPDMIDKIYKVNDNNYYLCVLNLKDDTKGYIGFYFNTANNKAYIFYIE